jgi:hypothetical protein
MQDGQLSNNQYRLNISTDFMANEMHFVPYVQYAPSIYRYLEVYWTNKNTGLLQPLCLVPWVVAR